MIISYSKKSSGETLLTSSKSISKGFIISRGMGFALSTEISLKFKELCLELIEPAYTGLMGYSY